MVSVRATNSVVRFCQWASQHICLLIAIGALLARIGLVLMPGIAPHGYDAFAYREWSWHLVHSPLSGFYSLSLTVPADHLPGDLWLLTALGRVTYTLYPEVNFYSGGYSALIAAMVTVFDLLLAVCLWRAGVMLGQARLGTRVALVWWCSPVSIFVTSVWGQTDAISSALGVVALVIALSGRYRIAIVALVCAALVKPQFALLVLPIVIGWARSDCFFEQPERRLAWLANASGTAICGLALVAIIVAPFQVSLFGGWGQWSLLDRIQAANDRYTVSVLGAHNFWGMLDPLRWPPDDRTPWMLGISRHSIGLVMFAAVVAFVCWILLYRWQGSITMVLSSNILMLGFFLFMTRMHERYMFPLAALSLLLVLIDRRFWRYAVTTHILVFLNIYLRFVWPMPVSEGSLLPRLAILEQDLLVQVLALISMVVFGFLVRQAAIPRGIEQSGYGPHDHSSESLSSTEA